MKDRVNKTCDKMSLELESVSIFVQVLINFCQLSEHMLQLSKWKYITNSKFAETSEIYLQFYPIVWYHNGPYKKEIFQKVARLFFKSVQIYMKKSVKVKLFGDRPRNSKNLHAGNLPMLHFVLWNGTHRCERKVWNRIFMSVAHIPTHNFFFCFWP